MKFSVAPSCDNMDYKISEIKLKPILDSKGKTTVEATIFCGKLKASAKCPHGTSAGKHEVSHLPENEISINKAELDLVPELIGSDFTNQEEIDTLMKELDGTERLSKYGGGTILAISMAVAKLNALSQKKELYESLSNDWSMPFPLGKCIGGGSHGREGGPDIQEFLVLPLGAKSMKEAIQINNEVHKETLKSIMKIDPNFDKKLDYEGGWNPHFTNSQALEAVAEAVYNVETERGTKIRIGLDVASSEFFNGKFYVYKKDGKELSTNEQLEYMKTLIKDYDLVYVEDPFDEEDFETFAKLTKSEGKRSLIVGDDLFTTNVERLSNGIKNKACNAIIIKPNQIGTISDTYKTVKKAKKNNYIPIISHRSGETEDSTIAQLAVGWNIPIIKIGIVGKERTAKLQELERIEKAIKNPKMNNIEL